MRHVHMISLQRRNGRQAVQVVYSGHTPLVLQPKRYHSLRSPVNSSLEFARGNSTKILVKPSQDTDFSLDKLDNGVGIVVPERCKLENTFSNSWGCGCVSSHEAKRFFRAAHRASSIHRIKPDAWRTVLVPNGNGRQRARRVVILLR